jgi:hypothetical protein
VGRKIWAGLVLAGVNSAVVCVIGIRTAQYGFIPANVFCIVTYAWSIRSWRRDRKLARVAADAKAAEFLARYLPARTKGVVRAPKGTSSLYLAYSGTRARPSVKPATGHLLTSQPTSEVGDGTRLH